MQSQILPQRGCFHVTAILDATPLELGPALPVLTICWILPIVRPIDLTGGSSEPAAIALAGRLRNKPFPPVCSRSNPAQVALPSPSMAASPPASRLRTLVSRVERKQTHMTRSSFAFLAVVALLSSTGLRRRRSLFRRSFRFLHDELREQLLLERIVQLRRLQLRRLQQWRLRQRRLRQRCLWQRRLWQRQLGDGHERHGRPRRPGSLCEWLRPERRRPEWLRSEWLRSERSRPLWSQWLRPRAATARRRRLLGWSGRPADRRRRISLLHQPRPARLSSTRTRPASARNTALWWRGQLWYGAAMRNLILGAVRSYSFEQVRPFVASSRRTAFDGDVVLLWNKLSPETLACATRSWRQIGAVRLPGKQRHNSRSRYWPVVRPLARVLNGTQAARRLLKYVLPLQTARFLAYHEFLAAHAADYRHVLLTDVRDVLFQDDPFLGFEGGLSVFEEDASALLVEERAYNARWVEELFGRQALARFGRLPILCSGTIMGTTEAVLHYLQAFERMLLQTKRIGSAGSDQGLHNYLCRFVIDPPCHVVTNGHGTIMTMGLVARGAVDFVEFERWADSRFSRSHDSRSAPIRPPPGTRRKIGSATCCVSVHRPRSGSSFGPSRSFSAGVIRFKTGRLKGVGSHSSREMTPFPSNSLVFFPPGLTFRG